MIEVREVIAQNLLPSHTHIKSPLILGIEAVKYLCYVLETSVDFVYSCSK